VSNGRLYEGTGFAFGVNLLNEGSVTGSIVAVGLHVSGPAVDRETRLVEKQNQTAILQALFLNQPAQRVAGLISGGTQEASRRFGGSRQH
jgi:hypothetical protein